MSLSVEYTADQDGAAAAPVSRQASAMVWVGFLATGTALGILFVKSEVLTWYRMQEMFRFQSIHMFGIIGMAILVAMLSQTLLTRLQARTMTGEAIRVAPKVATPAGTRYWGGGFVFGLGWALLGACPGPIFTLIGAGHSVYVVPLAAAVAGTYFYGALQRRLPH
jgi:uncharacterized membrane protein YedE/YeeE